MKVGGTFDRVGALLVLVAAGVAAVVVERPELLELAPVGLDPLDVLFWGAALALVGVVVTQLQTLVTPTPGRVAMTSGLVTITVTLLDYAPPLALYGGLALLSVGALLRQAEVIGEAVS